ncbi:MAG: hypothetical protein U1E78_02395 [Gammaproteobacteria bacterium]
MIELIIQGIASVLGGYFTDHVFKNRLGLSVFFFIVFLLAISVCLFLPLVKSELTTKLFLSGALISLIVAASLTLLIRFLYFLANRKKK